MNEWKEIDVFDYWREEVNFGGILTLCKTLDTFLQYGIKIGEITELCGLPGTGKTQICFQLCVNVQIPTEINEQEGKALFIDTNQGFSPSRLNEIAKHTSNRILKKLSSTSSTNHNFSSDSILENVSYIYAEKATKLLEVINKLHNLLEKDRKIQIIVIDSFSFPFREYKDYKERTKIIHETIAILRNLAAKFKVAVVITVEFTLTFDESGTRKFPSLGDTVRVACDNRLIFAKSKRHHTVFIDKCIHSPKAYIYFKITDAGITNLRQEE